MKKAVSVILLLSMFLSLCGCLNSTSIIPSGYTDKDEHYDEEGCQDYTDYCIYYYDSAEIFESNQNFRQITEDDVGNIKSYFNNFAITMESSGRSYEFEFIDFKRVTQGDYVCIITKEGQPIGDSTYSKFDNYTVYFFDTDTFTLYYIHNNI